MQRDFPGSHHFVNSIRADDIEKCLDFARISGDFEDIIFGRRRYDASPENFRFGQKRGSFSFRSPNPNQDQFPFDAIGVRQIGGLNRIGKLFDLLQYLLGKERFAAYHHRYS